jgi:dolichol-phosphate mannosyltransferase
MNLQTHPQTDELAPKTRNTRIIVVLPAYNEEANLENLLRRICDNLEEDRFEYSIIVVDDGSTDATPRILEQQRSRIPLIVETHCPNQGLGASVRDGLARACEISAGNDIIVMMDADETHTPGLIMRMVRMIREGHDVVIASRYERGARVYGLAVHRKLISWLASILLRCLFPIPGVTDYTCGYRAYRADVLKKAYDFYGDRLFDQDGFQCMVDVLLKLRKMPVIFGEVPLLLRYDLKKGQSKMRLFKTAFKTLRLLSQRRLGL